VRDNKIVPKISNKLACDLVEHHENKTILEINKDPEQSKIFFESFQSNQAYFKRRWQSAQSSLQS
jgi:hypothetical protein